MISFSSISGTVFVLVFIGVYHLIWAPSKTILTMMMLYSVLTDKLHSLQVEMDEMCDMFLILTNLDNGTKHVYNFPDFN